MMALITVHSTNLSKDFRSTWISRAALFALLCLALSLIVPFLVAYGSQGFWVKHQIHRERPVVRFKYQGLLLARSSESRNYVTWSSFSRYNDLNSPYLVHPSITSSEKFSNVDEDDIGGSTPDGLELDVQLDLPQNGTGIRFVQLLLLFSYQLKDVSYVNMESLAVLQYDSSMPLAGLSYVGDLHWVQRKLLPWKRTDSRYNVSIIEDGQYELAQVLRSYNSHLTEMRNGHYTPTFAPPSGGSPPSSRFRIQAYIRYAEAALEYAPGFWNTLKWAWIQYLALLVVFLYLFGRIQDYVFAHQLIPTWNEKEIRTSN